MNLPPLPEINPHDHPDPRAWKWTATEIAWIKQYASKHGQLCRQQALEEAAQKCDEKAKRNFPWASENSDKYHAQADCAELCAAAIRSLIK